MISERVVASVSALDPEINSGNTALDPLNKSEDDAQDEP
jgi:hypothetical protein